MMIENNAKRYIYKAIDLEKKLTSIEQRGT